MKKFKKFYFKKFCFDLDTLKASFFYSFDNEVNFEEVIDFWVEWFKLRNDLNKDILNNLCFHLSIALWISYYKLCPTNNLVVESWFLDENQISFWKKFYSNWLGEFLYTNKISPKWLFNFVNASLNKFEKMDFSTSSKALVAVWGWKDSIVSMELLEKAWIDFNTVVFWKLDEIKDSTIKIIWKKNILIKRILSENLFDLNDSWYYNWHIPITWVIAFVLEIVSYLYDYKYIVLSNEKSANNWNLDWEWLSINHQYSKSLEFEKDFDSYICNYISSNIKYFSLLRWFYELKIAEIFSYIWKRYFAYFSSCNNNFKIHSKWNHNWCWCLECPKCAFVFCILRAFLPKEEMIYIFSRDLYEDKKLDDLFRELLWISWHKPFECVWESEEVYLAMYLSWEKEKDSKLPFILKLFEEEVLEKLDYDYIKSLKEKFLSYHDEDIIPKEIKEKVIEFKN